MEFLKILPPKCKLFISHSMKNQEMLSSIEKTVKPLGFDLLIAEHIVTLDTTITGKVGQMMEACDIALILLTQEGFNSQAVQQEIGCLHQLKKPLLLVVQNGLEKSLSMFTYGRDYILLDPADYSCALNGMRDVLQGFWTKWHAKRTSARIAYEQTIREAATRKAIQKQERESAEGALWVIGGLALLSMMNTKAHRPRKIAIKKKSPSRRLLY